MTPEEVKQFVTVGRNLQLAVTVDGMERTGLYGMLAFPSDKNVPRHCFSGIHATMSIAAIASLLAISTKVHDILTQIRRHTSQKSSRYLLLGLSLTLILSTSTMTIIWIQLRNILRYGFIKNPEQSFQERWGNLARMNNVLQIPRLWLTNSVVSGIHLTKSH
jgi:hypothetical protein